MASARWCATGPADDQGPNRTPDRCDLRRRSMPPCARALRHAAVASVILLAFAGSMRWVAAAGIAQPASSPNTEDFSTEKATDRTQVIVRLIDDESGAPIVRAACEWGLANPDKPGEFIWGFRGSAVGRDGSLEMIFDLEHGRLIRFQVLAAGYERAEVVEEIPRPTPASLERTVRLKARPDGDGNPARPRRQASQRPSVLRPRGQGLAKRSNCGRSPGQPVSWRRRSTNADGSFNLSAGRPERSPPRRTRSICGRFHCRRPANAPI